MNKAEQPTITQADRDAAVEYFDPATFSGRDAWLRGDHDDDPLVQAFARHRTTSLAAQDGLVEALEKVRKCALVVPSIFPDTPPSVSWIVSELTKILPEMDAALSAIKGDKS